MLAEARNPKRLFSKPRCRLPHRAESGADKVALEELFRELVDDYNRNNTEPRKTRLVYNLSSHNLTLGHLNHFATWLEGSSLRICPLDLSCNRIYSDSWGPLLQAIARLCTYVERAKPLLGFTFHLSGNDYLCFLLEKLLLAGRLLWKGPCRLLLLDCHPADLQVL